MTSQETLRRLPNVDIIAQPVSRTEAIEHAQASTTDSTTIPPAVPAFLGFVAGYVDSCTFLAFNGLFVAQLTGSFVVAGSELVANNDGFLIKVLAIPVFFAAGVLTTIIVTAFGAANRRRALVTTLALEAALLAGLAWIGGSPGSTVVTSTAALFDLLAMGVQSAMVRLLLSQYGSTNVMTTNTTQLAIDLTETLSARHREQHNPLDAAAAGALVRGRLTRLVPIMLGFFVGTVVGGLAYISIGFNCVALAAGVVAALAIWAAKGHSQTR